MNEIQRMYADYVDQYALQELRQRYLTSNSGGRLGLLKKQRGKYWGVPTEIARLAVEDSDSRIRAWYAKHGEFRGEKELCERLRSDPDPLVRAALVEGDPAPTLIYDVFEWKSASELERLAYLRRRYVPEDFILKLFDPEDTELGVSQEDRTRYALTFLAAWAKPGKIEEFSERIWEQVTDTPFRGADLGGGTGGELIELMPKWPREAGVQDFVYRYCASVGHIDIVYEHCDEPRWRRYLLENLLAHEGSVLGSAVGRMLGLARKDPDDKCRELAHMDPFIGRPWIGKARTQSVLDEALRSRELAALRGLAQNKGLKPAQLMKVGKVLQDLNSFEARAAVHLVSETLQLIQRPQTNRPVRTNHKQLGGNNADRTNKKLERVQNMVEVGLNFLAATVFYVWLSTIVGIFVGGAIYVLSSNLIWATLTWVTVISAGLSVAVLGNIQFKRYHDLWGTHPSVWLRGLQVYPDDEDTERDETPKEISDEDLKEWTRMIAVFKRSSGVAYGFLGAIVQDDDAQIDPDSERLRIEKYKRALAEADVREERERLEEKNEESSSIPRRISRVIGKLLKTDGSRR